MTNVCDRDRWPSADVTEDKANETQHKYKGGGGLFVRATTVANVANDQKVRRASKAKQRPRYEVEQRPQHKAKERPQY